MTSTLIISTLIVFVGALIKITYSDLKKSIDRLTLEVHDLRVTDARSDGERVGEIRNLQLQINYQKEEATHLKQSFEKMSDLVQIVVGRLNGKGGSA